MAEEKPETTTEEVPVPAKAGGYSADEPPEAEGEPYPDITYGCAVPERLTEAKMEKKMKKIIKEGGKRGVEIEGAADMGGLQFFCTTVDEPVGDVDWLYESMRAMNAKCDPAEEERKGGSGHVGKMIISIDEAKQCSLVAYVPPQKVGEITAETWMKDVLKAMNAPEESFLSGNANLAKATILQ